MRTHAWLRQVSRFVDLRDADSQVKPHYGGRGHDGGELAFLFLYISGDCRCDRKVDFKPVARILLPAKSHPLEAPSRLLAQPADAAGVIPNGGYEPSELDFGAANGRNQC